MSLLSGWSKRLISHLSDGNMLTAAVLLVRGLSRCYSPQLGVAILNAWTHSLWIELTYWDEDIDHFKIPTPNEPSKSPCCNSEVIGLGQKRWQAVAAVDLFTRSHLCDKALINTVCQKHGIGLGLGPWTLVSRIWQGGYEGILMFLNWMGLMCRTSILEMSCSSFIKKYLVYIFFLSRSVHTYPECNIVTTFAIAMAQFCCDPMTTLTGKTDPRLYSIWGTYNMGEMMRSGAIWII